MKIFNQPNWMNQTIPWILSRKGRLKYRQSFDSNDQKLRVLFVCTANLCRSPLAEGILRKIVDHNKISGVEVTSAGTLTENGRPVSSNAVIIARENGVDIESHKATLIYKELLLNADIVFVMGKYHLQAIRDVFSFAIEKTYLLKNFGLEDVRDQEIMDPLGMSIDHYYTCFKELKSEILRISPTLVKMSKTKTRFNVLSKTKKAEHDEMGVES